LYRSAERTNQALSPRQFRGDYIFDGIRAVDCAIRIIFTLASSLDEPQSVPPLCHPILEESRLSSISLPSIGEHRRQFAQIGTDEFVGADGDGFQAFSVVTQDETRDTGDSGFLWV